MKKSPHWLLSLAWIFVALVTFVDLLFAYHNQHTLTTWEMNPVAVFLFKLGGFLPLIFLRLGIAVFGFVMSKAAVPLASLVTPIYVFAHVYLAACYAIILLDLKI